MAIKSISPSYGYVEPVPDKITNGVNTLSIDSNGIYYNDQRVFFPISKGNGIGGGSLAETYVTPQGTYIKPTIDRITYGLNVFNISNDGLYYNGDKIVDSVVTNNGLAGGVTSDSNIPKTDRIICGENILNVADDGVYYNGIKLEFEEVCNIPFVYDDNIDNNIFLWTSFEDIYCQTLMIKQDQKLQTLPRNEYYALCWRYLEFAIGLFQYDCLHEPADIKVSKVQDYNSYYEKEFLYIGNGIDKEFYLDPPERRDYRLYIAKKINSKYTETNEYTYDIFTNTVYFDEAPENGIEIKIVCYYVGFFNNPLDRREISILAEGMIIPFLEEQQNNRLLLNQIVYGGSVKMHSQAEHLKVVSSIIKEQYDIVDNLIKDYSYKSNRDQHKGLSGRFSNPVKQEEKNTLSKIEMEEKDGETWEDIVQQYDTVVFEGSFNV